MSDSSKKRIDFVVGALAGFVLTIVGLLKALGDYSFLLGGPSYIWLGIASLPGMLIGGFGTDIGLISIILVPVVQWGMLGMCVGMIFSKRRRRAGAYLIIYGTVLLLFVLVGLVRFEIDFSDDGEQEIALIFVINIIIGVSILALGIVLRRRETSEEAEVSPTGIMNREL